MKNSPLSTEEIQRVEEVFVLVSAAYLLLPLGLLFIYLFPLLYGLCRGSRYSKMIGHLFGSLICHIEILHSSNVSGELLLESSDLTVKVTR
jgi:hypothetical protein